MKWFILSPLASLASYRDIIIRPTFSSLSYLCLQEIPRIKYYLVEDTASQTVVKNAKQHLMTKIFLQVHYTQFQSSCDVVEIAN